MPLCRLCPARGGYLPARHHTKLTFNEEYLHRGTCGDTRRKVPRAFFIIPRPAHTRRETLRQSRRYGAGQLRQHVWSTCQSEVLRTILGERCPCRSYRAGRHDRPGHGDGEIWPAARRIRPTSPTPSPPCRSFDRGRGAAVQSVLVPTLAVMRTAVSLRSMIERAAAVTAARWW